MPYNDQLALHAPLLRPWLHPFRVAAVRRSLRAIRAYLEIDDLDEVLDEGRWLARPEWERRHMPVRHSARSGWDMWHKRRAGVELAVWHWTTQQPDAAQALYDRETHLVLFRGKLSQLHRDHGPARMSRGGLEWYRDDLPHREDGPARINASGERAWLIEGVYHREDGPAHIDSEGGEYWYRHGTLHRTDGPAIVSDDLRQWIRDGQLHREGGAALFTRKCAFCAGGGQGCMEWFVEGIRHRADGPAVIHADGSREWWYRGELHREGGPARERIDGPNEWWRHGAPINALDEGAARRGVSTLVEEFFQ